jgi:methionyl-tRNA formyltransferase
VAVATDYSVDPAARISKKKRIWSQYTPEEQALLREKVIATSMEIGIPCFTGAVKTDYFRRMWKAWDPEVLIMFCYGQKLDAFLYEYPVMGAYNLHPSDLPKKIGMGTQPFQNALRNGLKTSPLVIHLISELIDMGPIVGVSTPVNIRLADGSAPASILTLLEKITSLGGWMTVELVDAIIRKKAAGESGPVDCIDFKNAIPESLRCQLMQPAINDLNEMYEVPPHPLLEA